MFGNSEAATHTMSLLFGLLTIPVGMWAGWSLLGKRAGDHGGGAVRVQRVHHDRTARRRGCTR